MFSSNVVQSSRLSSIRPLLSSKKTPTATLPIKYSEVSKKFGNDSTFLSFSGKIKTSFFRKLASNVEILSFL